MSHVATVDLHVTDLKALAAAAAACGCELIEGQQKYKWYGRSVGDYPLPAGFSAQDLGKCEHAIRVKRKEGTFAGQTYEVGVCKRRDGKPGYTLLWDFWQGGFGLEQAVGKEAKALRSNYAVEVAANKLRAKGCRVEIKTLPGKRVIYATK